MDVEQRLHVKDALEKASDWTTVVQFSIERNLGPGTVDPCVVIEPATPPILQRMHIKGLLEM